jgi:hypothetical protein
MYAIMNSFDTVTSAASVLGRVITKGRPRTNPSQECISLRGDIFLLIFQDTVNGSFQRLQVYKEENNDTFSAERHRP